MGGESCGESCGAGGGRGAGQGAAFPCPALRFSESGAWFSAVTSRRAPRPWSLLVLLLVALGLASPWAVAQKGGGASQKLEAIRQSMERGQSLYVAKNYEAAAVEFEKGYQSHPYSAFLFNSGVCYQKLKNVDKALEKYREYLQVDPGAPDAADVKDRIAKLEASRGVATPPAGDAGVGDGGAVQPPVDAGAPSVESPDDDSAMRSLIVVETEPDGAPLTIFRRMQDNAAAFQVGGPNVGWNQVQTTRSPANLTLAVGRYHVVIEKYRDFNVSDTDIDVSPGHVHQFKANLSQGVFMAFLRVSANVRGAYIYLDDDTKQRPEWGTTPYGELVPAGEHKLRIEAPGFDPLTSKVVVKHGEQKEVEVRMARVTYGLVRLDANAPEVNAALDGEPMGFWRSGEAPLDIKAAAGRHRLTVEGAGRKTYEELIDVPKGQVLPVHANMIPKYPRGAAWTQAIIGAVFIGAAVWAGTQSNSIYDDLDADKQAGVLEPTDSRHSNGQIFAIGADAGFLVGGALGVLAIYNFVKDPLPPSSAQVDKPKEFEDPKQQRPTARAASPRRLARRSAPRAATGFRIAPSASKEGGGLVLGGSF